MAKRPLEETHSDLGLPLEVLLGKLIGALENVPEKLENQQKCISSIKTELKILIERDCVLAREKIQKLEDKIQNITTSDDGQDIDIKEINRIIKELEKRLNSLEFSARRKQKSKKEIIMWLLKQGGLLIFAGLAAALTAWLTVTIKGG